MVLSFVRNIITVCTLLAFISLVGFSIVNSADAQVLQKDQIIEVQSGIMKYSGSGDEAAFFGVNYSPPFAHSYRAINRLDKSHKKVIDQDLYHFARLDLDGFRIHIWDTEISDSLGNVINNEHLDLLDYMLAKLKQRNIRVILTPLTFYNNGYPEPPTQTSGFANYITKESVPNVKEYWPVIMRYLKQLINHRNPYTGLTYKEDPNIIATEIANEPAHDGSQDSLTSYVNMLADHLRSNDWRKPIFYNISQNPSMAEGVMNADIGGTSFQWYPGGLVGGQQIKKNYLPYIDEYAIPFADREAFQNKAQMVYEFDSADFLGSYAYPAMARSFRGAGFQWATQFAYDPMPIAPFNTDYRTHYLNFAYTPSKAISMKIASSAFHSLPRNKSYGRYPQNNSFENFRVDYKKDLSVLNADTAFFYTNTNHIQPKSISSLKHLAGVGSSAVVKYQGSGAYFLDKIKNGVWRLEVMPDVIQVYDPFSTVSLDKQLARIEWKYQSMTISLSDLGNKFRIKGINSGNELNLTSDNGTFSIKPGSYLLMTSEGREDQPSIDMNLGNYRLNEFVAPEPTESEPMVRHKPVHFAPAGEPLFVSAEAAGLDSTDKVSLLVQNGWRYEDIPMEKVSANQFRATIPAGSVNSGFLTYWITVDRGDNIRTFPGNYGGRPDEWDYYQDEQWQVQVLSNEAPIGLFNAAEDMPDVDYAFSFWNTENSMELISSDEPGEMAVRVTAKDTVFGDRSALGWKIHVEDKLGRMQSRVAKTDNMIIKAKGSFKPFKVIAVEQDGSSYSANLSLSDSSRYHRIPLSRFRADSMMLLPRPYPVFLPLWFKSAAQTEFNPSKIEELQFVMVPDEQSDSTYYFQIQSAWIEQETN